MPRKSRSKKTKTVEPEWLSYQEIMTRYQLSRPTIELLSVKLLLDWQPKIADGRAKYLVGPDNDFLLRLGCLNPPSCPTYRPPFLRFLLLRFFSSTNAEIIDELRLRGIDPGRLTVENLAKMRGKLTLRLPEEAQPFINGAQPKDEKETALVRAMLTLANVGAGYDRPVQLDSFYFPSYDVTHSLMQISATGAAPNEGAPAANTLFGRPIFEAPVDFVAFRVFFADFRFMDDRSSLSWYLNGLSPRTRQRYRSALSMGLHEFLVHTQAETDLKENLRVLGVASVRQAVVQMKIGTDASISSGTKLIAAAIRVFDSLGEIVPVKKITDGGFPAGSQPGANMTPKKLATYNYEDRFGKPESGGGEALAK